MRQDFTAEESAAVMSMSRTVFNSGSNLFELCTAIGALHSIFCSMAITGPQIALDLMANYVEHRQKIVEKLAETAMAAAKGGAT